MAKNMIYADIPSQRRVVAVPTQTAPGTPIFTQGTPMVTLTGSGDYDGNLTTTGNTVLDTFLGIGEGHGGVGLGPLQATATPTGTFSFPVTGSSASAAYNADGSGKLVYAVIASGVITSLTLTVGSNTLFGRVDFFRGEDSSTDTAVKIGATN